MSHHFKWLLMPLLTFGFLIQTAFSHTDGENYIFLEIKDDHIRGRFEFKYDDLKEKKGIDLIKDGKASDELLQASTETMYPYILENFSVGPAADSAYKINFTKPELFDVEGGFAQYHFRIDLEKKPEFLHVRHEMFYEDDSIHRGVLVLEKGVWPADDYEMKIAMILNESSSEQVLDLNDIPELMTPIDMIWQGVLHIWIGIDHILFLLALTLPVVLIKKDDGWKPARSFKTTLWNLLKIVTVFTIAHSITLLLAGMNIVTLPSRLVESVIALSIILVALNNILGRSQNISLFVILFLGLFHGLGFASVMGDLYFWTESTKKLIYAVIGFNIGVELGQIAILIAIFPILFFLRSKSFYRPLVVRGGSIILCLVATYWFIERAFDL